MKLHLIRTIPVHLALAGGLLYSGPALAADRETGANIYFCPENGTCTPRWSAPEGAISWFMQKSPHAENPRIVPAAGQYSTVNGWGQYSIEYEYTPSGGVEQTLRYGLSTRSECLVGTDMKTVTVPGGVKKTCIEKQKAEPPCDKGCPSNGSSPGRGEEVGNPIYPATGLKVETAVDYTGGPSNSLPFIRTYRSDRNGWSHNYAFAAVDYTSSTADNRPCFTGVGSITRDMRCVPYLLRGTANDFSVRRGNSRLLDFGTSTDLAPLHPNVNDKVSKVLDGQGQVTGWQVYNASNNATEFYDLTGRVTSVRQRDGRRQTFTYSDALTLPTIAPRAGLLISVADNVGYQLAFTYDANARMSSMRSPDGEVTTYQYDEPSSIQIGNGVPVGNLTSVTYPGGKKRIYWYNEQDKTAAKDLAAALTGITDENGVRYATYTYDATGRAVSTEHAGGVEKYRVSFGTGYSDVTDPYNQTNRSYYVVVGGVARARTLDQKAAPGSLAVTLTSAFDTQGNVINTKDANGIVTTFEYDLARNLETSRTEASGKPEARTTKTEWHPTLRIPARIAAPKLRTTMTFDTDGNVMSRTIQSTTDVNGSQGFNAPLIGQLRTWTYTYNEHGKLLTETGPRTDVVARTTYTYDAAGNLKTVTNPAGQVTTFDTYDANGRATKITSPNGSVRRYSYLPRGWLNSESIEDAAGGNVQTTSFSYDDVGQLLSVTMPDQSAIYYTYDPAHRLTDVQDSLGNKIHYTLDNMGNRISEQVTDPAGNLARQITRQYSVLNRLHSQTGGVQ